jgi:hypothetical protein
MGDAVKRGIIERMFTDEGLLALDAQAEHDIRHVDVVIDMPQSGERIIGRDRMRAMQEAFPTPPRGTVRRVVGSGDLWVVEGVNDYGNGDIWTFVDIIEFEGDLIKRETRYYGKNFDPPAWRTEWVSTMDQ